jgi:UDP-glucose 4-epimerase
MTEVKVLITGGAGFIGSHIASRLVERGIPTVIQDSFVQYFSPLDPEAKTYQAYIEERFRGIRGRVAIVRGDTRNKDDMRRLVVEHRPTHIIHLAALPLANLSTSFSEEAVGSILTGTINLLEIIRDLDCVKRFVYTSSSMVYGDFEYTPADEEHPKRPKDIYGGAKLCGEVMTQVYGRRLGIEYTIVRPSAVYGPTDVNRRVSQIFVENALRGKPLILKGGGEAALDFTFIEDAAEGLVLAALQPGGKNEVFNVTRGEGRSLLELAQALSRMIPGVQTVVEPADVHNPKRGALDISKARRLLGYDPKYSLEEGLKIYVDFVRAHMGG